MGISKLKCPDGDGTFGAKKKLCFVEMQNSFQAGFACSSQSA